MSTDDPRPVLQLGKGYFLVPSAVKATQPSEAGLHVVREPMADTDRTPPTYSAERQLGLLGNWYKRKNRGRSEELAQETGRVVDLVECYGDDAVAQQMTLTCQVRRRGDITAATIADLPAVVGFLSWGNDGYQSNAEVDFVQGAQISLAGSFVRFAAAIDLDAPNNGGGAMPPVVVGAHISYQPTAAPSTFRTRYFALAANGAPGDSVELPIPAFARSFVAVRSGAALQVEVLDRSGAVLASSSSNGPIELQLANDARSVLVTNLDLAASSGRLIFNLWL